MIYISCSALILVFITYYWSRVFIRCSGDDEMSSQAEILKAFDDGLQRSARCCSCRHIFINIDQNIFHYY